jgi:predicted CXXCH cytochrome family protein
MNRVLEEVHPSETLAAGTGGTQHQSPQSNRKEVGTVRRPALLIAGAMLWLFLAAVPVLADGGVHVADSNSGFSTLTADSCAGCHRAHTAQGEYLIRASSQEALCLTCHGAASTGATTDVMTGVQYAIAGGFRDTGTQIGALRNGGFEQSRIDSSNPARITYLRTATDASFRAKVGVTSPTDVNSAHLQLGSSSITLQGTLWGNGAVGSGAGPDVEIECTSCHNPHGNDQYRILNTLPAAVGTGFVDPVAVPISGVSATTDRFTTTTQHTFVVGDIVTISGVTGATPSFSTAAQYVIKSTPNGVTFTVAAAPTKTSADVTGTMIDITTGGTGGTVQQYEAIVDDAPLPSPGDVRNYSILEVRGYQGTAASYLLYASDVLSARAADAYDITVDIVGMTASNNRFTTGLAHGFAEGDSIDVTGLGAYGVSDGSYTISDIATSTTFTLTGVTIGANQTAGTAKGDKLGTATKSVAGSFEDTDGDYFHRTVPWNPNGVNAACPNDTFVDSTANPELASACTTAQDAPNGHPATVTGTSTVNGVTITPSAYGQIAFNDQISGWCSSCHSRYYSSTNPNPGSEPGSSAQTVRTISAVNAATDTITTSANHGYAVGDQVQFSGGPAPLVDATTYYVLVVPSNTTFRVSTSYDGALFDVTGSTTGGTVVRTAPVSASSWWFPRPGEDLYKFQHQTTTNRACVTCHVAHGSPAVMDGAYTSTYTYPDGTASDDGRLLKIDNRGTCQACHDPTGTAVAGQLLPLSLVTPPSVP